MRITVNTNALKWIGAVTVLALAGTVIVWRATTRDLGGASLPTPSHVQRAVLFIDLSESTEVKGCGEIIGAVRQAARRGVPTEEVDVRDPGDRAKRYRLLVAPTVLIVDADGHEQGRFEGESPETVRAIQAALSQLTPGT